MGLFFNNSELVLKIHKMENIRDMNKKLNKNKFNQETIYVANELAQNVINANTSCVIKITNNKIILDICGDKYMDLEFHFNLAKKAYEEQIQHISLSEESGKGLISIFKMGWNMFIKEIEQNKYTMVASHPDIQ